MYLIHITETRRIRSILRKGLDPRYARGRRKWVWLAEARRLDWLINHLSIVHSWSDQDWSVLKIDASDNLIQCYRDGIWYSRTVIPASMILEIVQT